MQTSDYCRTELLVFNSNIWNYLPVGKQMIDFKYNYLF